MRALRLFLMPRSRGLYFWIVHFIQGMDYNDPIPVEVRVPSNPEGHNPRWWRRHPEKLAKQVTVPVPSVPAQKAGSPKKLFSRLAHKYWGYVLSALSAYLATLAPDLIRALVLVFGAGLAIWTFHHTEFSGKRWRRTGPASALIMIIAAILFWFPRWYDHGVQDESKTANNRKTSEDSKNIKDNPPAASVVTPASSVESTSKLRESGKPQQMSKEQTAQLIKDIIQDYMRQHKGEGPTVAWVNRQLKNRGNLLVILPQQQKPSVPAIKIDDTRGTTFDHMEAIGGRIDIHDSQNDTFSHVTADLNTKHRPEDPCPPASVGDVRGFMIDQGRVFACDDK